MATIPRSRGPAVMPGRAVVPQASGAEAGMASARALENFGQTGQQVALNIRGDQMREEQRIADEQRRQAEREAEAERSSAAVLQQGLGKQFLLERGRAISARVMAGEINDQQAADEWGTATSEALAKHTEPLAKGYKEEVSARLKVQAEEIAGTVIREAGRVRVRESVKANLLGTLEVMERDALENRDRALQVATAAVQRLGGAAGYGPDDQQKLIQTFREKTASTAAYQLVNAAKNNPKLLTMAEQALASDKFSDLDPKSRAVFDNQIAGHRLHLAQQAEMQAARAARQQEAALNRARAEFETFQALADKGTVLAPEYIDRVTRATAGTPYQAGIKQVSQQIAAVGGLAAQSIATQQATLDAITGQIAKTGRTPELDARRAQVEKVLNGSRQDLQADPLRAGLERGVITELQPLNLTAGIPGVLQQIATRVQQANTVGQWAGTGVSPLLRSEAEQVATMLGSLAPDTKAQTIATLAQTIGPRQAQALAAQIDTKDRALALAMAAGSSMTTAGRPTSTLILKGQQAVADKAVKLTPDTQGAIAKAVGDALTGKAREDVIEAAALIYAGQEAEGGGDIKRAVRLAVGGDIIEHNGARVPIAGGMTARDFRDRVAAVKPEALATQAPDGTVMAGGRSIPLADFLASLPDAQLQPAGLGRYYVRAGGAVVTNSQRRPITIEVR